MQRMTAAEYRAMQKPAKYKNIKTTIDGYTFDSKAEAARYSELKLLKQTSAIRGFHRQPSFLFNSGVRYIADFIVFGPGGSVWVEDVKGYETDAFKIKRKLWESEYPYLELRLIK